MNPDYLLRRVAYANVEKNHVFRTLYKTRSGEWTENIDDGDWQPFAPVPHAALTCDIQYEEYWIVSDRKYYSLKEAVEAEEYRLVKKGFIGLI